MDSVNSVNSANSVNSESLFKLNRLDLYLGASEQDIRFFARLPDLPDPFARDIPDEGGVLWKLNGMIYSWWVGIVLLWSAMVLTVVTGADYLMKAAPFLRDN